jgi:PAS domain S-box-containing protein
VTHIAESGLEAGFPVLRQRLERGDFSQCMQQTLSGRTLTVIHDPPADCMDCPLANKYSGRAGLTAPLIYEDGLFGILTVSVPAVYADDAEEHDLFSDVAGDLARSLYRNRMQEQLHRLDRIFTTIPQPMALVDATYRYQAVNDFYSELYATSKDDIIGRTPADFLGTTSFDNDIKPYLDRCLAGETVQYDIQVTFPGVGHQWMGMQYYPFHDASGTVTGVIVHGIDITRRKQTERQIQASLQEKETLLQEIHHRIKNNLQVVASLLKMQAKQFDDPQLQRALQECRNRIYALSAVHETLHRADSLSSIDLNAFLTRITHHLLQTYDGVSNRIRIQIQTNDIRVSVAIANPLGLIINELVSNAIEHAFSEHADGEIDITVDKPDPQTLLLNVSDNGVGMPANNNWPNQTSLGLQLVRTLVERQLDGSVELEIKEGTRFVIRFSIDSV